MTTHAADSFPRGALIVVGALLVLTIISAGFTRMARLSAPAAPAVSVAAPVSAVDLQFADRPDGSIGVIQAGSGRPVTTLAPGTNGFVRGVLRGLARDRISRHIGAAPPFRLSQDRRGSLTLRDSATGRTIDLEAFGNSNRDAFMALLKPVEGRS